MQPSPPLHPVGPERVLDGVAILNGLVDMRTYQHKYLAVSMTAQTTFALRSDLLDDDYQGRMSALLVCVEWLDEHFGWELVNISSRDVAPGNFVLYAYLRRGATG